MSPEDWVRGFMIDLTCITTDKGLVNRDRVGGFGNLKRDPVMRVDIHVLR